MTTTNNKPFAFTITESVRAPKIRSVKLRLTNITAPGSDAPREIELTSFEGRPVEVYMLNPTDGLWMYQGTIAAYAPANRAKNSTVNTLAKAWFGEQKSKAARVAFETSARYA